MAAITIAFAALPSAPAADEPPARPAFEGFYVGASAAYSAGSARVVFEGEPAQSLTLNGAALGGFAGYGLRHDRLLLAAEIDGAYATAEDSATMGFGELRLETRAILGASAIAGIVVDERLLFYGRAGYRAVILRGDAPGTRFTDAAHGPSIGAGVALAIGERVMLRLEGRNSFLADRRYSAGGTTPTVDPDEVAVGLGLALRF